MTRRWRTTAVLVTACALLAVAGVWGATMLRADAKHGPRLDPRNYGPLSATQYAAAVRIAQHEADRNDARLTSATAIIRDGGVRHPNLSTACSHGQVISIQLTGRFPGLVRGESGARETRVEWVTADPVSGRACSRRVAGRHVAPYADAADLMPALTR